MNETARFISLMSPISQLCIYFILLLFLLGVLGVLWLMVELIIGAIVWLCRLWRESRERHRQALDPAITP